MKDEFYSLGTFFRTS